MLLQVHEFHRYSSCWHQPLGTDSKNKFLDRYFRAAGSPADNPHKSEPREAPFALWRQRRPDRYMEINESEAARGH